MNIDTIFIECLKLPVFARVEYLEAEQAKSNFSKETYIKILYDKWKEYKSIVFKSDLEKPFDDLVKEKGWEYAAITVYGDEPEPFEHIYSNTEYDEIETEGLFNNLNQNNFEWLTENVLWVLLDYIYRLYDKWETTLIETKTDKLKVPQIALIHVYEGRQITRENAGEIAANHGYTAKTSGEGLFQDYTKFCSMATRKGKPTPCTPQKLKNKIELFESVINYLSDNNKQRAIDEINILRTIFENEYQ